MILLAISSNSYKKQLFFNDFVFVVVVVVVAVVCFRHVKRQAFRYVERQAFRAVRRKGFTNKIHI